MPCGSRRRGSDSGGARVTEVLGMAELIGTAAAAVAAAFAGLVLAGRTATGVVTACDEALPTTELLATVARNGVRLQAFTGIPHTG